MPLNQNEIYRRLRTETVNFGFKSVDKKEYAKKRRKRIERALELEKGGDSVDECKSHLVDTLPSGTEVILCKSGKEAFESDEDGNIKNPNDMRPRVGPYNEKTENKDIWAQLAESAFHSDSKFMFDALLVMLYRNAYLMDHEKNNQGKWVYRPDIDVAKCIDEEIGGALEGDVLELLHFLDLLGWNEDVKYFESKGKKLTSEDGRDDFDTGRVNTLRTAINNSYSLVELVEDVKKNKEDAQNIDFSQAFKVAKQLSIGRGVSPVSHKSMLEWFPDMMTKPDK